MLQRLQFQLQVRMGMFGRARLLDFGSLLKSQQGCSVLHKLLQCDTVHCCLLQCSAIALADTTALFVIMLC